MSTNKTRKMKTQIIILIVAITFVAGQEEPQIFCGRRLSNALLALCPSEDYLVKRSSEFIPGNGLHNTIDEGLTRGTDHNAVGWGWLTAPTVRGMKARNKRGIVDECCYKPCSVEELISYC